MSKSVTHSYSRYGSAALSLMGRLVRAARKQRGLTTQETADRAGISRGLLQRIEKGDPKCGIGAVFEVATIVGVQLFDADEAALAGHARQTEQRLALLPKSVRRPPRSVADDF